MDEQEEMKTFSSSEEESDGADEDIENERRLQKALFEKDKVWIVSVHYWLNLQVDENSVLYCNLKAMSLLLFLTLSFYSRPKNCVIADSRIIRRVFLFHNTVHIFIQLDTLGAFFEAGRLLNFHYSELVVCWFSNKAVNNNKMWRCARAEFYLFIDFFF